MHVVASPTHDPAVSSSVLRLDAIDLSFGGVHALSDVSLSIAAGEIRAVIGPNDAGKTTFFNLISGAFRPDSGRILFDGEDIAGVSRSGIVRRGIGRAFQVASIFPSLTGEEALMGKPSGLLLDEPSEGLAPLIVQRIGELLRTLRDMGITVLLAEQNMHFCLGIATEAAVIDKGQIVYRDTITALRTNTEVKQRYFAL